jgi:MFS family permease
MPDNAKTRSLPPAIRYLFLVRLINSAGSFVQPFMTMLLTVKLGWPADRAGLFMTCTALAGGGAMLVGGKLGDAVGRKRLIVACQAGASVLFLSCFALGFDPALPFLAAGANVLLSATWPVFNAVVADLVGPADRRRAYSLIYWGNNIGFSLGPLAAGFLFNQSARFMFLVNALALAAVSTILGLKLRETRPCSAGAATEEPVRGEAAEKGGLLAVLARRPLLLAFAAVLALLNLVYAQHQFSLPLFLDARMGSGGPSAFGLAMTVNGLTVVACTVPIAYLSKRLSPLACMPIAGLFYALGFGMLSFFPADSASLAVLVASTVVWTVGEILAATSVNAHIASRSPESHRSRLNSMISLIAQSGSMVCPLVSGAFVRARGIDAAWPAAALLGFAGTALMAVIYLADRARPART